MRTKRLLRAEDGLSTVEYIIGAAVILGTLVVGINSWNQGLVAKLEQMVMRLGGVE